MSIACKKLFILIIQMWEFCKKVQIFFVVDSLLFWENEQIVIRNYYSEKQMNF